MYSQYGVRVKSFPGAQGRVTKGGAISISSRTAKPFSDFAAQRLDISVPQAAMLGTVANDYIPRKI